MSIYDIFGGKKSFDKAAWAAKKQEQRKEAYDLIEVTCGGMKTDGECFRRYLDVQGRFDRYSVNNAILISVQMPEATQLKDYNGWKQSHAYVDKDAQKVTILEPGKEYQRDDGTKAVGYNAKEVYDIVQTSAKDRQEAKRARPMRELVSAMIDASPVVFQPIGKLELPAFYDASQQVIFIQTGLGEEELFTAMTKETAAAVYDLKHKEGREASEFGAYCVAYMISSRYGVNTRGFDFGKLPEAFADMETQKFKTELGKMRDVLGELQGEMYRSLEKNKAPKEKGRESHEER